MIFLVKVVFNFVGALKEVFFFNVLIIFFLIFLLVCLKIKGF